MEFLAIYYQKEPKQIKKCLRQTAKKHSITKEEVANVVVGSLFRFSDLPPEIIIIILETLSVREILNLCKTSYKFSLFCTDNRVWKYLIKRDFGLAYKRDDAKELYITFSKRKGTQKLSCATTYTGVITKSKKVYIWGGINPSSIVGAVNVPMPTPGFSIADVPNPSQISMVSDVISVVTNDKKVYIWRIKTQILNTSKLYKNTHNITLQEGVPNISQISLGKTHSGAVTLFGEIYLWGSNHYGQLGIKSISESSPVIVTLPDDQLVDKLVCGDRITGVITSSGKLYTWGWGPYGQLGDGTSKNRRLRTFIKRFREI